MELLFSEERRPGPSIINHMEQAGKICVREAGLDPGQVSVSITFVSSEEIRELNLLYRKIDAVTDVLSFPQYAQLADLPSSGPLCLGDVVICTEQALLQADDYGHSPERELTYLFVHSMLHLLGHDHMTDDSKSTMRRAEEAIMEQVGLSRD